MADIWMDVDAAISEAPINLLPLIDDTDFKTREESVTYNQSGLDLVWNFVTTAGAMTQTAVTPTDTAGVYDWVSQGNGMYTIEIPASGGGTINNDTEGFGWFTGFATGILPWRGPVIGFRAVIINNALVDGARLEVDVVTWKTADAGTLVTEADINAQVDTALADINLDHLAKVAESGDVVDDTIIAKLVSKSATAAWSDFVNTTDSLQSLKDVLGTATDTDLATDINNALVKWTTAMTEDYAGDGSAPTPEQMLFMLWSYIAERVKSDVTVTTKKLDGSTTSMTFTLNDTNNPTSITRAT